MYLVKVTVTSAKKNHDWVDEPYGIVLNTARINALQAYDTNYSQFKYLVRDKDRRSTPDHITTSSTVATIQTACESSLLTNLMYLPVYVDDDITSTPVTVYEPYSDFAFARPDHSDPDSRSYVYFSESPSHLKRYLVNLTIDELVDYAGSTTTTKHVTYA